MTHRPVKVHRESKCPKAIEINPQEHAVYYRATQVRLSAPCLKSPALEVGMRVAILQTTHEFSDTVPKPIFYAAKVAKIGEGDNPLVTFEYEDSWPGDGLMASMDGIAKFCVVLSKKRATRKKASK